jgi:ligand-binding SRPBCC domain-containing protein
MRIIITTNVEQSYKSVFQGFTETLFLALAPPFPKVKLLRFDGCKKGDQVHLEMNLILFKQRWDADIIDSGERENELFFIDNGAQLPFFLKTWKHHHRIIGQENNSTNIVDDFEYTTPFFLFDYLMYPVLYLQFAARKPIYKRIFCA